MAEIYAVEAQDAHGKWIAVVPMTMPLEEARAMADERHTKNPHVAVRVADMNHTVAETWRAERDPNEVEEDLTTTAHDLPPALARDLLLQAIFAVYDAATVVEAERVLNEERRKH